MKFEPLKYYTPKRIREDKAFTIDLTELVTPLPNNVEGHRYIPGASLTFSVARRVAIYGSFKFEDELYIFRRETTAGVFAYTNVAATSVIFIKG